MTRRELAIGGSQIGLALFPEPRPRAFHPSHRLQHPPVDEIGRPHRVARPLRAQEDEEARQLLGRGEALDRRELVGDARTDAKSEPELPVRRIPRPPLVAGESDALRAHRTTLPPSALTCP